MSNKRLALGTSAHRLMFPREPTPAPPGPPAPSQHVPLPHCSGPEPAASPPRPGRPEQSPPALLPHRPDSTAPHHSGPGRGRRHCRCNTTAPAQGPCSRPHSPPTAFRTGQTFNTEEKQTPLARATLRSFSSASPLLRRRVLWATPEILGPALFPPDPRSERAGPTSHGDRDALLPTVTVAHLLAHLLCLSIRDQRRLSRLPLVALPPPPSSGPGPPPRSSTLWTVTRRFSESLPLGCWTGASVRGGARLAHRGTPGAQNHSV